MTDERFKELICGTLSDRGPEEFTRRLEAALRFVVDATGDDGDAALSLYCIMLSRADRPPGHDVA